MSYLTKLVLLSQPYGDNFTSQPKPRLVDSSHCTALPSQPNASPCSHSLCRLCPESNLSWNDLDQVWISFSPARHLFIRVDLSCSHSSYFSAHFCAFLLWWVLLMGFFLPRPAKWSRGIPLLLYIPLLELLRHWLILGHSHASLISVTWSHPQLDIKLVSRMIYFELHHL